MRKTLLALAALGILFLPAMAWGQGVPVVLSPVPKIQFFGANGAPLASGCVYTTISGSSTPQATYVDGGGQQQNQNPIQLDGGGFASIYLPNLSYRFTVWSFGGGALGSNCGGGVQQYSQDNVNPWNILNTASNLFALGQVSDPSPSTAGEIAFRSDLSKFRGFTTLWDSFVMETTTATLSNKTLTTPTINTPTITTAALNGVTSVGGVQAFQVSGTTLQVGGNAASSVTLFAGNDTLNPGAVNVTAGTATGAGTGGAVNVTAGNGGNLHGGFVVITGGNGTANDANGGNVTLVPGTGNGSGTPGTIALQGIVANYNNIATVSNGVPAEYAKNDLTNQSANVGSQGLYTVPSTGAGMYRVSCYVVVTTAATTSSTLPSCNLIWVDKDNSNSQSANVTATSNANTLTTYTQGTTIIDVAASTSVTWSTAGYATSGATSLVYAVHIKIEAL